MRVQESVLALLALPYLTAAVSLYDWTPRLKNLPSACDRIYKSQISGCQPSDFNSTPNKCSVACVHALANMVNPIKSACGNHGIEGENLIVAFLANQGPGQLCKNADAILGGGVVHTTSAPQKTVESTPTPTTEAPKTTEASKTPVSESSSMAMETSSADSSESSMASSSASKSADASSTSSARITSSASAHSSSSTGGLIVDTSSTPTGTGTGTTSSTQAAETKGGNTGGGSPFDAPSTGSAASLSFSSVALTFGMAALALGAL